jgi:hypothetical protein
MRPRWLAREVVPSRLLPCGGKRSAACRRVPELFFDYGQPFRLEHRPSGSGRSTGASVLMRTTMSLSLSPLPSIVTLRCGHRSIAVPARLHLDRHMREAAKSGKSRLVGVGRLRFIRHDRSNYAEVAWTEAPKM